MSSRFSRRGRRGRTMRRASETRDAVAGRAGGSACSAPHARATVRGRRWRRAGLARRSDRVSGVAAGAAAGAVPAAPKRDAAAGGTMPSTSEKQRRFMGADLARKRAGQATETGMTESQLEDFAKAIKKKPAPAKAKARTDGKESWER